MLSFLLPETCPACGAAGAAPCHHCRRALRPAPRLSLPAGLDLLVVVCSYEGIGRELVARLKYHRAGRASLPWLAAALAARCRGLDVDAVTWVPTSRRRRWGRGFDQSELVARRVARHLRVPCRSLLVRGSGPPQTGRGARERHEGPRLAARPVTAGTVLLVDDVVTTGASLASGAAALRAAGARSVIGAALARTPLKVPAGRADL